MDKYWKATERRIAKMFDTRRTPLSGLNSGHNTSSDTLHNKLYIEIKCRKLIPDWLTNLTIDTRLKANKESKIPVVVLHKKGGKNKDDFAICNLVDLITIAKEIKEEN